MGSNTLDGVHFFADPCCPWTWNTSRWLVDVSSQNGMPITWRTLCLAELNRDREVPEHFRPRLSCSRRLARILEGYRSTGRNADIAAMFTAFGTRLHIGEQSPGDQLLHACAIDCDLDVGEIDSFADDETLDAAVAASVLEAMDLAGPDVGSPILSAPELGRGFFGPIVSPPPTGDDALTLWGIVDSALRLDTFFEMKRGRRHGVEFTPQA